MDLVEGAEPVGPDALPDVLASRYASAELRALWSPTHRVVVERRFWLTVLEEQERAGWDVPAGALADYRAVVDRVDLASIRRREERTLHDVKARIEEFDALAGHELVHAGLTSRDLTENVEAALVRASLGHLRVRLVALLGRLAERATELADLPVSARTHLVPAQVTTMGKRFATLAEEGLLSLQRLDDLVDRLPVRGIKGAVGTQLDQAELLGGVAAAVAVDRAVAERTDGGRLLDSTGQITPRSVDHDVVSTLVGVVAPAGNLALLVRLGAGLGQVSEGFGAGQVGSSAMPHKMNARSAERIGGLLVLLRGYEAMTAQLAGAQWFEGDVSCSVVRRVALPHSLFVGEAALTTAVTVCDELTVFPAPVAAELARELPFLATSRLLTAAVRAGAGREQAHEIIRDHAVAAAATRVAGGDGGADLIGRLAADARLPMDEAQLRAVLDDPVPFAGRAGDQVAAVVERVGTVLADCPAAADFRPPALL